jgi:hypothetical protein
MKVHRRRPLASPTRSSTPPHVARSRRCRARARRARERRSGTPSTCRPGPPPPRAQHAQPVPITKTGFCSPVGLCDIRSQPAAVEMGCLLEPPAMWPARP